MKKLGLILLSAILLLGMVLPVMADEDEDVYYLTMCSGSDLTEAQKKKYRLYDNKTAEMASWDQRKLSAELCDVDFQGYDFGQPKDALPDEETEEAGPKTMTCPCCGEVFEV